MLSFFCWSETFNLCIYQYRIYLFTTARLECLQRCQSSFPTLSCQTRWQNNTFRNIKGVNNNNELFIDTISFNKGQDYCLRQSMPSKVLLPMTGWYFDGLSSVVGIFSIVTTNDNQSLDTPNEHTLQWKGQRRGEEILGPIE